MAETVASAHSTEAHSNQAFDEAWYLKTYPDVAAAVARGGWKSGYQHFEQIGKERGRFGSAAQRAVREATTAAAVDERPPEEPNSTTEASLPSELDLSFYASSYPLAREEVSAGLAVDFEDHYESIGKYRGYRPNREASRPDTSGGRCWPFGGFWTDQANADDLLNGKLDLGYITRRQAEYLTCLIRDGYVVVEKAIPDDVLDRADSALILAYHGGIRRLLFDAFASGAKAPWSAEVLVGAARALDLHWLSSATRDLIFAPALIEMLHLVMERRAFATQSLGFWRGAHQDVDHMANLLPMGSLASWIVLEDIQKEASGGSDEAGSRQTPENMDKGYFGGIKEAEALTENVDPEGQTEACKQRVLAQRGDIVIWSSKLSLEPPPIFAVCSVKGVLTYYMTAESVPSYFERESYKLRLRHGGEYYSSAHYDFEPSA